MSFYKAGEECGAFQVNDPGIGRQLKGHSACIFNLIAFHQYYPVRMHRLPVEDPVGLEKVKAIILAVGGACQDIWR